MKKFQYMLEAAAVWLAFFVFRSLSVENASALGGWIGRTIGPRLAASRKAAANLKSALPDKMEEDYVRILADMWENLGRVMAEYPHLKDITLNRCDIVG